MSEPRSDSSRGDAETGLAGLATATVERVLQVGRLVHIPRGWTPIRQGEPADEAYFLLEGQVRVVRDGESVATLGPGEFAGEMGLVDRSLRSARVTIVDPVLAVAWPRADFQALRSELADFDDLVVKTSAVRREENTGRSDR